MTDPQPDRPTRSAPLEPWALDLLNGSSDTDDTKARQETERIVALLRNLESPEADPERADRVIRALAEQATRPNVLRAAFGAARLVSRPPVALALAAGMAGLLAIAVAPGTLPFLQSADEAATATTPATGTPERVATNPLDTPVRSEPIRRRTTPVIRPQLVNVSGFSSSSVSPGPDRYDRAPYESSYDRGLDRQLNQLMIDPHAFAVRLETIGQRDRFIARLAERAAERGDAPEIALRVRQSRHPLAVRLVDRLLRSTFVATVSPR